MIMHTVSVGLPVLVEHILTLKARIMTFLSKRYLSVIDQFPHNC